MTETSRTRATNKELFLDGFERFAAGDIDVLNSLLREDFVEHSPGNPSGRDAFVAFMKASPVATADLRLKRVIADGEYVVAHYQMLADGAGPRGVAVVDIWRFEDGQIAEHWDVMQPVPEEEQVPNGMF